MSVLTDLATLLTSVGAPVVPGRRPAAPDRVVSLQTYPGDPNRILDANNLPADERLAVQVTARAERGNQAAAEALAEAAFRAVSRRHVVLNGRAYDWIRANHYPAYVGVDENDRPMVVVNVTARRRGSH